MREVGAVTALRRYPVKSMLGEGTAAAAVTASGVDNDRVFALIDEETGRVASAKQPRLWRKLLQCSAGWDGASYAITLPDGNVFRLSASDAHGADGGVDRALSELLGRRVRLTATRPGGAAIARPAPEDVIEHGVEAELPYEMIEIGQGSSGSTFVDYAPVSLITMGTIAHLGTEWVRYRPNVVVTTVPTEAPFVENDWVGREIRLGAVRLRGLIPIPRCAIPTLEHGDLPRALDAVRALLTENRIGVPGFGTVPCAGLYAEVLDGGVIHAGDTVTLS